MAAVEQSAAATTPGWYMIVNDYYDGDGDGKMRCLSANGSTSTSGPGTHSVYLAPCNSTVKGQWWRLLSTDNFDSLRNRQEYDGQTWCMSGNLSTPAGGGSVGRNLTLSDSAEGTSGTGPVS